MILEKVEREGRRITRPELRQWCVGRVNSEGERGVVKCAFVWAQLAGILNTNQVS